MIVLDSPEPGPVLLKRVVALPLDVGPQRVPEGKLLVLGGNRGNSRDGRYFGFIGVQRVSARAVVIYARSGHPTWRSL